MNEVYVSAPHTVKNTSDEVPWAEALKARESLAPSGLLHETYRWAILLHPLQVTHQTVLLLVLISLLHSSCFRMIIGLDANEEITTKVSRSS